MPTSVALPGLAGEIRDYANKRHYEAMLRSLQDCAQRMGLAFVRSTGCRPARHHTLTVEQLNHLCLAVVTIRWADMSPNLDLETLRDTVDLSARDGTGLAFLRYMFDGMAEMGISVVRDESAVVAASGVHDPHQNPMTATFHRSLDAYLAARTAMGAPSWMSDDVWQNGMTRMHQDPPGKPSPCAGKVTNSPRQSNEIGLFSLHEGLEEGKLPHPPIGQ